MAEIFIQRHGALSIIFSSAGSSIAQHVEEFFGRIRPRSWTDFIGESLSMKRFTSFCLTIVFITLGCARSVQAQSIEVAKDYYFHNVKERALASFIDVFHNAKTPEIKAEALYYMGQISFDETNYSAAFADWTKLIKDYPNSQQAGEIKDRLTQMREVMGKVSNASISSTVAGSYLRNGDFWSK